MNNIEMKITKKRTSKIKMRKKENEGEDTAKNKEENVEN